VGDWGGGETVPHVVGLSRTGRKSQDGRWHALGLSSYHICAPVKFSTE
jgi:hypothetical protein